MKILNLWSIGDIIEAYSDDVQITGNFKFEKNDFNLKDIVMSGAENFSKFINGAISHSMNKYKIENIVTHQILCKDNFVTVLGEFEEGDKYASMHLLRFEGDKVVEYWDVIEPVPTAEVAKNSGKF